MLMALGSELDQVKFYKNIVENEIILNTKGHVRVNCDVVHEAIYIGQRSRSMYEFYCKIYMGERFVKSLSSVI